MVGVEDFSERPEYRSFVHFNISSIPTDSRIVSARFDLYSERRDNVTDAFGVYRVTGPSWHENFNWNDSPCLATSPTCVFSLVDLPSRSCWAFLDVTSDVQYWLDNPQSNYGVALRKNDTSSVGIVAFTSRHNTSATNSMHPFLEVSYLSPSPVNVTTQAMDGAASGSVSLALNLQFFRNGTWMDNATTDLSGVASLTWVSMSALAYNWSVTSPETDLYRSAVGSSVFDFRFPANVTVSGENNTVYVDLAGVLHRYSFDVASSSLFGLGNMTVRFYLNGTFANGTAYVDDQSPRVNTSVYDGRISFDWAAPDDGTYFVRAEYDGTSSYKPCETYVTMLVHSRPVAILFNVSKQEFEPDESIYLNATMIDPSTNMKVSSGYTFRIRFFNASSDGSVGLIGENLTSDGETGRNVLYPDDGKAYAFKANITSEYAGGVVNQSIISSPVQLTVSKSTVLLLDVVRDLVSVNHTIQGRLLWGSLGVNQSQVKIAINDTEYAVTTNSSGYFSLSLNLQCKNDNATTYNIQASFEDDATQPLNATAYSKAMDGTAYPACSTVQYGYKPAFNSTSLTVLPQSTETLMATQSQEEMQHQAEQSGALTIWHEFSWWYPWYRLHVKIHVNPTWEMAFSPILPDEGIGSDPKDIWDFLTGMFQEFTFDFIKGVAKIAVARITAYLAERPFILAPLIQGSIMLAGWGVSIYLLSMDWNNKAALYGGALGALVAIAIAGAWKFAPVFTELLMYLLHNPAVQTLGMLLASFAQALTTVIKSLFRSILDAAEVLFGVALLIAAVSRASTL